MQIIVNHKLLNVFDLQIVFDKCFNKYLYFIEAKCYAGKPFPESVVIDVFKSAEEAIKRYEYLKENIDCDLVIER